MAKIYTRTGDLGETGLFRGPRVGKDSPRIEAYGTVDETNSVVGMLRTTGVPDDIDAMLNQIQNDLFRLGAELATPKADGPGCSVIDRGDIERLERWIDELDADLPPMRYFVLPGGCAAASVAHLARTVCRRAERRVVTLIRDAKSRDEHISLFPLQYLNRLSDLLFVVARVLNARSGTPEPPWIPDASPGGESSAH
ncbi:cob(I)yrinic acid a,c-diamide adenosyltransferase [Thermostilla marina]